MAGIEIKNGCKLKNFSKKVDSMVYIAEVGFLGQLIFIRFETTHDTKKRRVSA